MTSKKICDYGCGLEGVYLFGNDKWCCSEYTSQCPEMRRRTSIFQKYKYKNETEEEKNIRIENHRKPFKDKNMRLKHGIMMSEAFKKDSFKDNQSKAQKKRFESEFERERMGKLMKITIMNINKKYPNFTKLLFKRNNPDKPSENEVQVRCNYKECKNSKINDGWFTPTHPQLYERIRVLDKGGKGNNYLYCSIDCKYLCSDCATVDPERINDYRDYIRRVLLITRKSIKEHGDVIKNLDKRGKVEGYDLDHKYSIYEGFVNNIHCEIVGHVTNLEVVLSEINRSKRYNCSISLDDLLNLIEEFK